MKVTLKHTLIGLGVSVIGYTVFAEFYNRNQTKKNNEEKERLSELAKNEPQEYENGIPIKRPITTDMDLAADTKGKIFNPLELIRNFNPFFGFGG